MAMILSRRPWGWSASSRLDSGACLSCQWRSFSASYYRYAKETKTPATAAAPETPSVPSPPSALEGAPRAYGKAVSEFTPKPLDRPIGVTKPPRPGENTGIDHRSWKERRDDFVNYDKHLVKRKQLTAKMAAPYYREWSNMRHHKGKSFVAPPKLFKADRALYFPNFYGQTLIKDKQLRDTTPVLEDKVSVVSVFSSAWAENQAATFVSDKQNPELNQVLEFNKDVAQRVQINLEDNLLKSWIINLFRPRLRRILGKENWGRYFVVRKGVTDENKDAIGLLNSKVGYTYLIDGDCRIRWAGSGNAEPEEKEGLVRGLRRLVEEHRSKAKQEKATVQKRV
ncbi:ATP10 protein-domain-containing protein [Xylogone sp. PMI_703]|nr:ATP10 protein-domain-containing protein [Xylogone sp. PMI_703]